MADDVFFLHYAAHSDFADGIFVPYATQVEAERQAAYDLMNGMDPEFIERIFRAPYDVPKFGWMTGDERAASMPHLFEKERKKVLSRSQIVKASDKHRRAIEAEAIKGHEDHLLGIQAGIRSGSVFQNAVPGNAYTWQTGGTATATPAALVAATAKTLVLILSGSANQSALTEVGISFDGVTSSNVPVLVELVSGTAGTAGTPRAALAAGKQLRGWPTQVSATTCGDTYSVEPGTQLVNRKWLVTPNGGMFVIQFPMGREPTGIVTAATDAKTWSIRATAPVAVNAHAYIEYEE